MLHEKEVFAVGLDPGTQRFGVAIVRWLFPACAFTVLHCSTVRGHTIKPKKKQELVRGELASAVSERSVIRAVGLHNSIADIMRRLQPLWAAPLAQRRLVVVTDAAHIHQHGPGANATSGLRLGQVQTSGTTAALQLIPSGTAMPYQIFAVAPVTVRAAWGLPPNSPKTAIHLAMVQACTAVRIGPPPPIDQPDAMDALVLATLGVRYTLAGQQQGRDEALRVKPKYLPHIPSPI